MLTLRPYRQSSAAVYNPFREMEALERAFFGENGFLSGGISSFRTDIQDKGDHYLLEADLPGFRKEDIAIDIDGETLSISAQRHSAHEEKDQQGNYLRCERSYGAYKRCFDISGIQENEISASYENGVLSLTMPKKDAKVSTARRLAIK